MMYLFLDARGLDSAGRLEAGGVGMRIWMPAAELRELRAAVKTV